MSLAQASGRYFTNLEARGLDAKGIRTYRTGVDPFVQTCKKPCVEDVTKQAPTPGFAFCSQRLVRLRTLSIRDIRPGSENTGRLSTQTYGQ
jgi:hypothetical protein